MCVCVGGSKLEAKLSRSRDTILSIMAESEDEKYMGSKKWFKIERHN